MRLGGPLFTPADSPAAWAAAVRAHGYRAAFCPLQAGADESVVRAYTAAAAAADVVIAEVGAWSNPISPCPNERAAAIAYCQRQLDLAERVGARCCVNITGSRHPEQWDGPHPDNVSAATFDLVVESVRMIVDAVAPRRTCYTLETMPWALPDSAESYLTLLEAIDRPCVAVHLDPVNLVNSPRLAYDTARLIRHCCELLGPHIKSCHAKDIALAARLTTHLEEVRPGLGCLEYAVYLRCLDALGDVPLMLEHLPNAGEYAAGADYIRGVAAREGITL